MGVGALDRRNLLGAACALVVLPLAASTVGAAPSGETYRYVGGLAVAAGPVATWGCTGTSSPIADLGRAHPYPFGVCDVPLRADAFRVAVTDDAWGPHGFSYRFLGQAYQPCSIPDGIAHGALDVPDRRECRSVSIHVALTGTTGTITFTNA